MINNKAKHKHSVQFVDELQINVEHREQNLNSLKIILRKRHGNSDKSEMESVSEETLLSVLKKLQELEENQTLFLNKFEKLDENTEAIIKIQTAFIQIKVI